VTLGVGAGEVGALEAQGVVMLVSAVEKGVPKAGLVGG
jgi:hypothetical protein